ncbi:tyrosine-type recombinase/integrase [Enterobacter hormaechei]
MTTITDLCHAYTMYSKEYKKSYRSDCSKFNKYIIPQLGDMKVVEVTRNDLQHYINGLTHLQRATRNRHIAIIKALFTFAREQEYIEKSPAAGMRAYKEPASLRKAMEPEEFAKFIKVLKNEILIEPRDTLSLIMLLAFTGLRLGEARSALMQDVDFKKSMLFLRDTKSGDSRLVPLCGEAKDIILMQKNKHGSNGLIFRSKNGGMASEPRRLMTALCEKAGIDKYTPHSLRYTAGSAMLAATRDLYAVKRFLGHKCISTTTIYAQYFGGQQHEDIERAMALMLKG